MPCNGKFFSGIYLKVGYSGCEVAGYKTTRIDQREECCYVLKAGSWGIRASIVYVSDVDELKKGQTFVSIALLKCTHQVSNFSYRTAWSLSG